VKDRKKDLGEEFGEKLYKKPFPGKSIDWRLLGTGACQKELNSPWETREGFVSSQKGNWERMWVLRVGGKGKHDIEGGGRNPV